MTFWESLLKMIVPTKNTSMLLVNTEKLVTKSVNLRSAIMNNDTSKYKNELIYEITSLIFEIKNEVNSKEKSNG